MSVEKSKKIRIPGGHARAFELRKGQFLRIVDLYGGQVADFIAFNLNDPQEKLSPTHTRTALLSLRFSVGDEFKTNFRNPMFRVVEDSVGTHDAMIAACDEQRYLVDYGVAEHRSCVANFEAELKPFGISRTHLPDPFNIFQNTELAADGTLTQRPSLSNPGDYLELEVKMDALAAVSACPMDLNPIGGDQITDIEIRIFEPLET
jgi:uncharacterized protein YcgI (DUF1989 family)